MTYFRTTDIFYIEGAEKGFKYFNLCHKKALKCGLVCKCIIDGSVLKLVITGTKYQFLKYYLHTLCENECKWDGIKRIALFLKETTIEPLTTALSFFSR